jgi:DNA-damage-inducible protein J
MKTAVIHMRIDPRDKTNAEKILRKLGLSMSEVMSIFFKRFIAEKGIPFDVKIPNKETRKAIADTRARKGTKYKTVQEMMDDVLS